MTEITFYTGMADKSRFLLRLLCAKILPQKKRALIYAGDADAAADLDNLLWTMEQGSFVPHCLADSPLAAETPVLIAAEPPAPDSAAARCEILCNFAADAPPFFSRHPRLLEFASAADLKAGRRRYKLYQDRGYQITHIDCRS